METTKNPLFIGGRGTPWRTSPVQAAILLKQPRRELPQVLAPIVPGVRAAGFLVYNTKLMPLKHVDRGTGCGDKEIILACREPEQFQPCLKLCVIEDGFVLLFESGALGLVPSWTACDAENARAIDAKIGEFVQVRDANIQRVCPTH